MIAFIEGAHADWDINLPELVSFLNNSAHSSTGVSPALLNYGWQPLPPATMRREQERAALAQRTYEATEAWLCLKGLDRLCEEAASRASEEHARQAVYYNERRREHSYEVGTSYGKKIESSAPWLKESLRS